jgi:hypothetical protein
MAVFFDFVLMSLQAVRAALVKPRNNKSSANAFRITKLRFVSWCVVVRHVHGHKGICGVDRGDAMEPQFLDQSILQRQMSPLDAPFGGGCVRADAIDVQFV